MGKKKEGQHKDNLKENIFKNNGAGSRFWDRAETMEMAPGNSSVRSHCTGPKCPSSGPWANVPGRDKYILTDAPQLTGTFQQPNTGLGKHTALAGLLSLLVRAPNLWMCEEKKRGGNPG